MRVRPAVLVLAALAACHAPPPVSTSSPLPAPDLGVPGVVPAHLQADFWIRLQPQPERVILSPAAIAAQNRALLERDRSVYDLERLPATLTRAQVRDWVAGLSRAPTRQLFDQRGDSVAAAQVAEWVSAVQLDAIPSDQTPRFALISRRANLRTFPTATRVFSARGNTDIDRFQETALFPGTPVVIVHESRDGQWWFVVSQNYAAWVEKAVVAEGTREQVLGYAAKTPFLVVTGARVLTVFTPERPEVSELQLDMSVRVPELADWPADRTVNGQHPYAGRVIELPVRSATGGLDLVPTLLPSTADVSRGYLPLTQAALLRQAFKFLGERYGWGHSYNGRDCSGFAGDVYRAFGVFLPRNTGDQAASPVLNRVGFSDADGRDRRLAVLRDAQPGDLVFIPGHEMMVIGHVGDVAYIIHDVTGVGHVGPDGAVVRVPLNEVSVTPLTTLASRPDRLWIDAMTAIQRIRPQAAR
jgi:hypothetical protein